MTTSSIVANRTSGRRLPRVMAGRARLRWAYPKMPRVISAIAFTTTSRPYAVVQRSER